MQVLQSGLCWLAKATRAEGHSAKSLLVHGSGPHSREGPWIQLTGPEYQRSRLGVCSFPLASSVGHLQAISAEKQAAQPSHSHAYTPFPLAFWWPRPGPRPRPIPAPAS